MTNVADESIDLKRGVDYTGVTVCALVHDGNGKLLMMKRGHKARDENGKWDIVGGALEFGERLEDAVRREIMEEICAEALEVEFIQSYEAHRVHNGQPTHWIAMVHSVQVDPSQVSIGEPHKIDEIGWFNLHNLPEPRHSMFPYALESAKKIDIIK